MPETVIGSTMKISGEISGSDALVVKGQLNGKVSVSATVLVDEGGRAEGEVAAAEVEVRGEFRGNIAARKKCQIRAGGKMLGDIKCPRILIADGALFRGKVDMDADPGENQ